MSPSLLSKVPIGLLAATAMLFACAADTPSSEPAATESAASEPSTSSTAPSEPSAGSTAEVTYEGIDVSHYQGDVDWPQVKAAGMTFAFAKATQGTSEVDPMFSANWTGMAQAGLVRGAYHFFDPDVDATAQAEHFIATVELAAGDLPPVIDIEVAEGVSTEDIDDDVRTWFETVAAAYGVQPILYSDLSFIDGHLASGLSAYPLWIAEYSETPPQAPGDWSSWTFWQYSNSGAVAGIDGAVDQDRYQGTEEGWRALLVPASP